MAQRRSSFTSTRARIKLRRVLKESTEEIKPVMKKAADDMRDTMIRRAPRDTGNLAESITSFVAKNGLRAEAGIRGKKNKRKAFYAYFVEFGTKAYNMRPQPFIQPAWDEHRDDIRKDVGKAINRAVKRISEQ